MSAWTQFSLNYPSTTVTVSISCFDTKHPTIAPSVAPTTAAPTLAPTEICDSVEVWIGDSNRDGVADSPASAVTLYNGVYNKQASTINGYDWWVARNDVGGTESTTNATLYFSTSNDRWIIEAPDVYFEANTTHHAIGHDCDEHYNDGNDRRRFQGMSEYFGENSRFQFSLNYASTMVDVVLTCFDTRRGKARGGAIVPGRVHRLPAHGGHPLLVRGDGALANELRFAASTPCEERLN